MDDLIGFDRPLFKKLAHNDTGMASGHQAGILIPKSMDEFFPQLSKRVTLGTPTVDEHIRAALFAGDVPKGIVSTRYQYQTWGETRPPERRITGGLAPLRDFSRAGDFLIIERGLSDPSFYRMKLLNSGTAGHSAFEKMVGQRRWGPVYSNDPPVIEEAISDALAEQREHEANPLELFDNSAALKESRTSRIARSRAFQQRISSLYSCKCVVCGGAFRDPAGASEIEAAHIYPRALKGADDARNGLALCRSHHWAFDKGLFGIDGERSIYVPNKVLGVIENEHLRSLISRVLRPPTDVAFEPALSALEWHRMNIVGRHS